METTILTNYTATQLGKAVKDDFKKVSPFYFINELNKLAKQNAYIEGVSLAELANRCKAYQKRFGIVDNNGKPFKVAFVAEMLNKDYKGRFVKAVSIPTYKVNSIDAKSVVRFGEDTGTVVDNTNGFEVCYDNGGFYYWMPITLNHIGFIDAFVAALKAEEAIDKASAKADKAALKAAQKAAAAAKRQADKESRKAEKQAEKDDTNKIKALLKDRKKGIISEDEFTAALLCLNAKVVA